MSETTMIGNAGRVVYVPVTVGLLPEVYRVLSQLMATAAGEALEIDDGPPPGGTLPGDLGDDFGSAQGVGWKADALRKLARTPTGTTQLISRMLDVLAETPDQFHPTSDLIERLDVTQPQLRGSLGGLTRHLKKHYRGLDWPMIAKWGADLGEGYNIETYYKLEPELASTWKQVRAG